MSTILAELRPTYHWSQNRLKLGSKTNSNVNFRNKCALTSFFVRKCASSVVKVNFNALADTNLIKIANCLRSWYPFFFLVSLKINASPDSYSVGEILQEIDEEIQLLLELLPPQITQNLIQMSKEKVDLSFENLVEIILDLGRKPLARFLVGDIIISEDLVSSEDIDFAVAQVWYKIS